MLRAATAADLVIESVDNSRCLGSKSQAHTCKRAGQTLGFACRFDSQPRPLAQDHAREAVPAGPRTSSPRPPSVSCRLTMLAAI
jgi:hypothetical protein